MSCVNDCIRGRIYNNADETSCMWHPCEACKQANWGDDVNESEELEEAKVDRAIVPEQK